MRLQPRAEPALGAKHQHIDQAGNHGRDGERQVDQGQQDALAAELELGDAPRCRHAKHQVQRYGDGRRDQGQLDGGNRVRIDDGGDICFPALLERFGEHGHQGHDQKGRQEQQGDGDQYRAHPQRLQHDGADIRFETARLWRRIVHIRHGSDIRTHDFFAFPRVHACSRLIVNNSRKDTTSITTAMAVAPA